MVLCLAIYLDPVLLLQLVVQLEICRALETCLDEQLHDASYDGMFNMHVK